MKYTKGIRRVICALLTLAFLFGVVPMNIDVAAASSGLLGEVVLTGNRDFKWPVPDYHNISACFYDGRDHYAIDIGTITTNADIVASYDGEVVEITQNGAGDYGYGNAVMLRHTYPTSSGTVTLYTRYAHMSEISESLSVGTAVVGGETVLGKTGGTGYGSANYYQDHLDFQILTSNDWLNRQSCSIDPFANNLLELPSDLYLGGTSSCCQSYIDEIKALYAQEEHVCEYEATVTPPTCTEDGYTTYACSCGDSYTDDEVTALGHSWQDGVCIVCSAAEPLGSGTCGDNLTWELDANGVLTISGTGDMTDFAAYKAPWNFKRSEITSVVIKPGVTSIGDRAFYDCYALTEITIPEGVTGIGNYAFHGCSKLTEITIPDTVTVIGKYAFCNCSRLTEITIPDGITSIGASTFDYCKSLTEIAIPNSVTSIGDFAFRNCDGLAEITIPDSVTSIGGSAFYDCDGVTEIIIPDGVTSIGDSTFYDCDALTKITIPNSVTSIGGSAFYTCTALAEITIPNSVTSIGAAAFHSCVELTEITIPDSVTSIGSSAFNNCKSLTEVTIGKGVTSIGGFAFRDCDALTEIIIPNSVTSIGESAFNDCSALTEITIPNSATSIGDSAFFNCKALTDVYYGGTAVEWSKLSNRPYAKHIHYSCIDAYNHWGAETGEQDPSCTEKGGNYKTCDCGYKKYVGEVKPALGHNYGTDGSCTVCGATEPLGSVAFSDGVSLSWGELQKAENGEKYGYDASAITDDTIGASAFYNCQKIVGIFIHKGVTVIGDNAFNVCSNLNHVLFAGTEAEWSAINIGGSNDKLKVVENHFEAEPEDFYSHINCVCVAHYCSACGFFKLRNISGAAHNFVDGECTECDAISEFEYTFTSEGVQISGYNGTGPNMIIPAYIEGLPVRTIYPRSSNHKDKITSVTIPYGVTTIGDSAFYGLKNLTSVNIPDSVTKIGDGAFQGCSSLTSIEIPNSVTSIDGSAFAGCDGFKTVLIPSSVKEMGERIFAGCDSLESVTFADGATFVGSRMFEDCSNLESVYLPDSLKQIRSSAFRNCVNLANIELPDGLEMIWNNAFTACSKIASVRVGKNLKSIGSAAFSGCSGITEVHIDDLAAWCSIEFADVNSNPISSVNKIKVFVNGEHLTELVIPEGVTSIGDYAFCFFRELTSVVIPNTVKSIGRRAFAGPNNLSNTIVIPESVTSIGEGAFGACRNITDVVILGDVSEIGSSAFSDCDSLERITLPDSIKAIRSYAFFTIDLNEIFYEGTKEQRAAIEVGEWNSTLDTATWHYEVEDSATHWQRTTTATCTTAGYSNKHCDCGYTQNNVWEPALGHSWAVVNCSTPKTCSVCGATGEVPGHDMGDWVIADEATCTENGSKRKECSRCDHFETEEIPAAHNHKAVVTPPTCTEDGYTTYTCSCGDTYTDDKVTAPGHSHKAVVVPPTCTKDGYTVYTCRCGDTYTDDEVTKLGHSWQENACGAAKTCTVCGATEGFIEHTELNGACSICGAISVSETNFPDDNFRKYISEKIDGASDGWLTENELKVVTSIYVELRGISSLKGIEFFTSLESLLCGENSLTELDLSKNINLKSLECDLNSLRELDLSKNVKLESLKCDNNSLTELDLSKNTEIDFIECSSNALTALVLGNNSKLGILSCSGNNLTELDLSGCPELWDLSCASNQLTELDLSACPKVRFMACSNNKLTSLDVSVCRDMWNLYCGGNQLTSLNVSGCKGLYELYCNDNYLTSLDLSTNTSLSELDCSNNALEFLDLSNNVILNRVDCSYNLLTSLDLSKILDLHYFVQEYNIRVVTAQQNKFDLSTLPGFDVSKVVEVVGGTLDGNILTAEDVAVGYYYDCGNDIAAGFVLVIENFCEHSWSEASCTEARKCALCGAVDGEPLGHSHEATVTPPTCTEDGYTTYTCRCGDSYTDEVIPAGHDMGEWETVTEATPESDGEERRDCSRCDHFETRPTRHVDNMLKLEGEDFLNQSTVYINGLPYPVVVSGDERYVDLPTEEDCSLVTYTYYVGDPNDVHTQYPNGMKVYMVSDGEITYIEEFDNLLQYSGSSIRITGNKGIRMITSLYKNTKSALTGNGLAGYKLVEYGTVLAFAHEVEGDGDLVLGKSYSRSNYAYKRGVADPVFANKGNLTQYTNVLVGFNLDQCKEDIAMRPYIILENAEGEQFTIYGGTIYRSIGYVAYQNRNAVKAGTAAYTFVWDIIHHVYGDQYDSDYKG